MRRILGNVMIMLLIACAVTAVLILNDAVQRDDQTDEIADPPTAPLVPAPPTGAADMAATNEDDSAEADTATPDHLQTDDAEAQVLGVAVAQEAESNDALADTGPLDTLRWVIIASGAIAAGGVVRGVGRDHARGELTLMG